MTLDTFRLFMEFQKVNGRMTQLLKFQERASRGTQPELLLDSVEIIGAVRNV